MFVLELTYTAPVEAVDALIEEHRTWLDGHYATGAFLASGRKEPRDGGIILAVADSRAAVEKLCATDPFAREGACGYRVTEFIPTKTAAPLEQYRVEL